MINSMVKIGALVISCVSVYWANEDRISLFFSGFKGYATPNYSLDYISYKSNKNSCLSNHRNCALGAGFEAYLKNDYDIMFDAFSDACEFNQKYGCYNLGIVYSKGIGTNRDLYEAKKLFLKSCEKSEQSGCDKADSIKLD